MDNITVVAQDFYFRLPTDLTQALLLMAENRKVKVPELIEQILYEYLTAAATSPVIRQLFKPHTYFPVRQLETK